jgi:hypothetical protein
MLKTVALVIVAAIAAVLVYAATRPDSFRVQRSVTIHAPPEKIFALIDTLPNWAQWSPYEKLDPAMKRSFEGPDSGKGAVYGWDGNDKAGAGRMQIIESAAPSRVLIQLDFSRPFEGHNTAEFALTPAGDSTTVVWAMYGPSPYISKLMGVFFNLDQMIGKDFETGLANLKSITEATGA